MFAGHVCGCLFFFLSTSRALPFSLSYLPYIFLSHSHYFSLNVCGNMRMSMYASCIEYAYVGRERRELEIHILIYK